jgi:hypothetical protein
MALGRARSRTDRSGGRFVRAQVVGTSRRVRRTDQRPHDVATYRLLLRETSQVVRRGVAQLHSVMG